MVATLISTRRTGLISGPAGPQGPIGPPTLPIAAVTTPAYSFLQNPIVVTHANPGTINQTSQLAIVETNTGTTSVTIGAPVAGLIVAAFDTDCQASLNNTSISSATQFVDPNSGGLTTSATLSVNGYSVAWYYDPNRGHYAILWAYYPLGLGGSAIFRANHNGGVAYTPSAAAFLAQPNVWGDVTGGTISFTVPTSVNLPDAVEFSGTNSLGDASASPMTFTASGTDQIEDPNTLTLGSSAVIKIKRASARWKLGKTEGLWLLQ